VRVTLRGEAPVAPEASLEGSLAGRWALHLSKRAHSLAASHSHYSEREGSCIVVVAGANATAATRVGLMEGGKVRRSLAVGRRSVAEGQDSSAAGEAGNDAAHIVKLGPGFGVVVVKSVGLRPEVGSSACRAAAGRISSGWRAESSEEVGSFFAGLLDVCMTRLTDCLS